MKKKLTAILVALLMAFGGTSVAMLSGCNNGNGGGGGGQTTESEYKVKFVDETGKEIKTVTVKSGETVTPEQLPEKAGYAAAWVTESGAAVDFTKGITADVTYKVAYTANTDTAYVVEHWFEGVDGTYAKDASKTENKSGTTGAEVSATALSEAHYTVANGVGEVMSGTIAGDGSLVLKVYYAREEVTVTFEANGEVIDTVKVKYGAKVEATEIEVPSKDKTESTEFKFVRWNTEAGVAYNFENEVTGNVKLVAYYEQTTRMYELGGEMYISNLYYFAINDEGDAWVDDESFDPAQMEYGYEFTFKLELFDEAQGTPVVTLTKYNDDGTTASTETLTADTDGYYAVTMNKNAKLEIGGLTVKQYEVVIPVNYLEYEVEWANPYNGKTLVFEIIDEAGNKTYHESTDGTPLMLAKGLYTANVGEYDANGSFTAIAKSEAFQVSQDVCVDGKVTLQNGVTLGQPFPLIVGKPDKWTLENGRWVGSVPDKDGQFHGTLEGVVPGNEDFAVVATQELNLSKENGESDPTLGFAMYSGEIHISPRLNRNGMRVRQTGAAQIDIGGLVPGGNMLGANNTGYSKVTEVFIRKGNVFYVFVTGERVGNASIQKVENKLLAYIDEDGILHACNGVTVDMSDNMALLLENGIDKIDVCSESTNLCYTETYGIGYTADAEIIDSYLALIAANVTVSGDYSEEKALSLGTNVVEIPLPEGKRIDTITMGGKNVAYQIGEGSVSIVIDVPFTGGQYDVNVTYADGAYNAVITGNVVSNGVAVEGATVTDGKVTVTTDANGAFTLRTLTAASYELTVTAAGYSKWIKTITDITTAVEVEMMPPMMGGTTTLGGIAYGAANDESPNIAANGKANVYELSYDAEGNEIYSSKEGLTKHRAPLMYSDFAASKFVAKAAISYQTVFDAWIRIGFVVADANGTLGNICVYGNECSSVYWNGWAIKPTAETIPVQLNGSAQRYVDAGKIEVALFYDNGNVKLYARCVKGWNTDKWILVYEGDMPTTGNTPLSGPVAVGLVETQNKLSSYSWSDFYIGENLDAELDLVTTEKVAITCENNVISFTPASGYAVSDILKNGKSIMSNVTATATGYTYTLSDAWKLDGDLKFEAVAEEVNAAEEFSGKVLLGGKPASGIKVEVINKAGLTFSTVTGEEGTFSFAADLGGEEATLKFSGDEILDKEMIVTEGEEKGDVNVYYAFKKAGEKVTSIGEGIEIVYDKTSENPYDGLVITQVGQDRIVAWNQPFAEQSAFGYTYKFADDWGMGKTEANADQFSDYDAWLKGNIGGVSLQFTAGGNIHEISAGASEVNYNIFNLFEVNRLKAQLSVGINKEVSLLWVRNGATLSLYMTATGLDRYYHVGDKGGLPATGTVQYYVQNAGIPGNLGKYELSMKNFVYTANLAEIAPVLATVENATVTMDKAAYANAENGTLTVAAKEGYLVTAVTINGEKRIIPATNNYQVELKALAGIGINVSAVETVAESTLVSVSGTVTIPAQYENYFDLNGQAIYESATAKYVADITDGAYSIKVPAGTYKTTLTVGELKATEEVAITEAVAGKTTALSDLDQGFIKKLRGNGMYVDGKVIKTAVDGATIDVALGGATFVPNSQVLEMGYTLKGNLSGSKYPFFGFVVQDKDAENKLARLVYTFDAGDQIGLMAGKGDWSSRIGANDKPWEIWKGGFVPGQKQGRGLEPIGIYNENAYTNLTFKFKVDGYKFSMWVKGTNTWMHNDGTMHNVNLPDWTLCFENLDVYARYNSSATTADGKPATESLETLYSADAPCYFGISARQDAGIENMGLTQFTDAWFTITDKE